MRKVFSKRLTYKAGRERKVKDHPYILPIMGLVFGFVVVAALVIFSGGQTLQATDSKVVDLRVDGQTQAVTTRAETVGELIDKLAIELVPEDSIDPAPTTPIIEDGMQVSIERARPVTVIDGQQTIGTVLTASKNPLKIGEQVGIKVYIEDKANFAPGSVDENIIGEKLIIERAKLIYLNLYGTPIELRTHAEAVSDFLAEREIEIPQGDNIQPAIDTVVSDGMQIFILSQGKRVIIQEEVISPPVEYVNDPSLPSGKTVVKEAGQAGKKVTTYEITETNGVESDRKVLQTIVISQPVRELRARGTQLPTLPAIVGDKAAMMSAAGIPADQQAFADHIISRESGWNYQAQNRSSGAYGLCQALPGSKMATAGADWQTNPITQLRWCNSYASRYGGWAGAYNWWIIHHWW